MLEHPSDSGGGDPAIGLLAALTRAELAADAAANAALHAAIRRFPAHRRLPALHEAKVGDWIASDVNTYPSDPDPAGGPLGRLDPDAHAQAVIREVEPRCEALGVDPSSFPAVALTVATIAVHRGYEQRKAARLHDARSTAASLTTFAKSLAQRDPEEPTFQVLLGQAFEQESKNARRVLDYPAIRQALRKAPGEARTALSLDPRNIDTRVMVANLQEKLVGRPSEPPSSR